jgi:hypothetical protein
MVTKNWLPRMWPKRKKKRVVKEIIKDKPEKEKMIAKAPKDFRHCLKVSMRCRDEQT